MKMREDVNFLQSIRPRVLRPGLFKLKAEGPASKLQPEVGAKIYTSSYSTRIDSKATGRKI